MNGHFNLIVKNDKVRDLVFKVFLKLKWPKYIIQKKLLFILNSDLETAFGALNPKYFSIL